MYICDINQIFKMKKNKLIYSDIYSYLGIDYNENMINCVENYSCFEGNDIIITRYINYNIYCIKLRKDNED